MHDVPGFCSAGHIYTNTPTGNNIRVKPCVLVHEYLKRLYFMYFQQFLIASLVPDDKTRSGDETTASFNVTGHAHSTGIVSLTPRRYVRSGDVEANEHGESDLRMPLVSLSNGGPSGTVGLFHFSFVWTVGYVSLIIFLATWGVLRHCGGLRAH